jgi:hypothetical protein
MYGEEPISGRLLINLWKYLPADSACKRSVDPEGAIMGPWNTTDHLLATLMDQIDNLSSMFYSANTGKNPKKWVHIRIPRPQLPLEYAPVKVKRSANANEVRAILRGEM